MTETEMVVGQIWILRMALTKMLKVGGSRKYGFILVNPRNIIINTFIGKHFHTTSYMPFNNAIRRFIIPQGFDGELLLHILDAIEVLGNTKYINEQLQESAKMCLKVTEFEVAIKAALLNWTSGIASNLARYGANVMGLMLGENCAISTCHLPMISTIS